MTAEELLEIDAQLAMALKGVDVLLFWTGVESAHVQRWAMIWKLKTLTIAMGSLMDPANPKSPKAQKSRKAYSKYVKGASGRFAQYARQHCRVVVLTNPPPDIYSSRENNTYQRLEEPILKGLLGDRPVRRIDYVHPTVDGAAHITYQAWPYNKINDWVVPFGGKNVSRWKKLNWSYKSLITTSQEGFKPLQKQILPIVSTSHILTPQSSIKSEDIAMNSLSRSNDSPDLIADNTDVERTVAEGRDVAPPQQDFNLVEEDQASPILNIRGHESRIFDRDPRPGESTSSDSHITDTQVRGQVDQRIDFHEEQLSCGLDRLSPPGYSIKSCRVPMSPITLPVICIDDIAVGAEVTVNIDEHKADKDFLYLTMRSTFGCENWWKMGWVDQIGNK